MNQLFNNNRLATVLHYYRNNPNTSVSALASKLGVSERTIRNDIKQINQELLDCAVIEGLQGKYTLRILKPDAFKEKYSGILQDGDLLNSSRNRMDYIFGRLMRSATPLLADELAYEMSVGRTTFMNDLKKLRIELAEYHLDIKGITSKGLLLSGAEMDIRNYLLERSYECIYRQYPLDAELSEAIAYTFYKYPFEKDVRENLLKFATLMLDRFLTGHYIGPLQDKYYNMTARPEFQLVDQLVDRFGQILRIDFPVEEKLFLFLPILGMRTPADLQDMQAIELDEAMGMLADKIFDQIYQKTNIFIDSGEYTEEFLYHIMFMVNRLRFGIRLKNPLLDELKGKYPLAYKMTDIATKVIEEEYSLYVTEDERGYLAAYFSVFLTENDKQKNIFRVAVVCGTGRVTARLISAQLKKILDSSAEITVWSDEKVTSDILNQFDIVLTSVDLSCSCNRPIIQIREIFNERELLHKIEKAKYWNQIEIPVLDNNWFVMAGLLDEQRFFRFDDSKMEYMDAVRQMAEGLYENGDVDEGFFERLLVREEKGMTAFDHSVAIPHVLQYEGDRVILAIGVCEKPLQYHNRDVSVIFMIGLPSHNETDDNILIRVYDEIIAISQDEELLRKICKADSFSALLRALYKRIDR